MSDVVNKLLLLFLLLRNNMLNLVVHIGTLIQGKLHSYVYVWIDIWYTVIKRCIIRYNEVICVLLMIPFY